MYTCEQEEKDLMEVYCAKCRKLIGFSTSDTLIAGEIYCKDCAKEVSS